MEILERELLEQVLSADFGYYRGPEPIEDIDNRLHPALGQLLTSSLTGDSDVLDIGCGDGSTLLSLAGQIRTGVGIDNDPEHLGLAERARRKAGITNVSFEQLVFAELPDRGWDDRFDVAFSERGPVGYSVSSVLTALGCSSAEDSCSPR